MKLIRKLGVSIFLLFMSVSCFYQQGIPVMGITHEGKKESYFVPKSFFTKNLSQTIDVFSKDILFTLEQTSSRSPIWELSDINIGVSLSASIGIDELVGISANTGLSLIFIRI